ncbi:hypothetical protein EV356DRAFT_507961 [Viridothelium virens]|uniref:Uncharacterized protein n=1 Tax=Viridothelium virens TaxID=1048519 RepID=A0A6A6GYV2_VIRVR|nr:hypothetical protein EV356DRAFT_507961 [Viridothelium virens]
MGVVIIFNKANPLVIASTTAALIFWAKIRTNSLPRVPGAFLQGGSRSVQKTPSELYPAFCVGVNSG